jgi:hypothetical protein
MTYNEKIKASKEVYNAIQAMEGEDKLYIQYGEDKQYSTMEIQDGRKKHSYTWVPNYYEIRCRPYGTSKSWSIYEKDNILSRGMNVDAMTKTTMTLYSYDLFKNKTTYRLPLYLTKLIS